MEVRLSKELESAIIEDMPQCEKPYASSSLKFGDDLRLHKKYYDKDGKLIQDSVLPDTPAKRFGKEGMSDIVIQQEGMLAAIKKQNRLVSALFVTSVVAVVLGIAAAVCVLLCC